MTTAIISPTNLILSFAKTGQGGSCIGGVPGFVGVSQPQGREASISLPVYIATTPGELIALSVSIEIKFACATGDLKKYAYN